MNIEEFRKHPDSYLSDPLYEPLRREIKAHSKYLYYHTHSLTHLLTDHKDDKFIGEKLIFFDQFIVDISGPGPRVIAPNTKIANPKSNIRRMNSLLLEEVQHLLQDINTDITKAIALNKKREIFNKIKLREYNLVEEIGMLTYKPKTPHHQNLVEGFLVRGLNNARILIYKDPQTFTVEGVVSTYMNGIANKPNESISTMSVVDYDNFVHARFRFRQMTWSEEEKEFISSLTKEVIGSYGKEIKGHFLKLNEGLLNSNDANSIANHVQPTTVDLYSNYLTTFYIVLRNVDKFGSALGKDYAHTVDRYNFFEEEDEENFDKFTEMMSLIAIDPGMRALGRSLFRLSIFKFDEGEIKVMNEDQVLMLLTAIRCLLQQSVLKIYGSELTQHYFEEYHKDASHTHHFLNELSVMLHFLESEVKEKNKLKLKFNDDSQTISINDEEIKYSDFLTIHQNALKSYTQSYHSLEEDTGKGLSPEQCWETLVLNDGEESSPKGNHFIHTFKESNLRKCVTKLNGTQKENIKSKLKDILKNMNEITKNIMSACYIEAGTRLRFTELQVIGLDGSNKSLRFNWEHNLVSFIPTYEKNGETKVREAFLSTELSKYMLHYIIVLRPMINDIVFRYLHLNYGLNKHMFQDEIASIDIQNAVDDMAEDDRENIKTTNTTHDRYFDIMEKPASIIVDHFLFLEYVFGQKGVKLCGRVSFNTVLRRNLDDNRTPSLRLYRQACTAIFRKLADNDFMMVAQICENLLGHGGNLIDFENDTPYERYMNLYLSRRWLGWIGLVDNTSRLDFLPLIDQTKLIESARALRYNEIPYDMGNFQLKYLSQQTMNPDPSIMIPLLTLKNYYPKLFVNIIVTPNQSTKDDLKSKLEPHMRVGSLTCIDKSDLCDVYIVCSRDLSLRNKLQLYDMHHHHILGYLIIAEPHLESTEWIGLTSLSFFKVALISSLLSGGVINRLKKQLLIKDNQIIQLKDIYELPHKDRVYISYQKGSFREATARLEHSDFGRRTCMICSQEEADYIAFICENNDSLKSKFIHLTSEGETLTDDKQRIIIGTKEIIDSLKNFDICQVIVYNYKMETDELIRTINGINGKGIIHMINETKLECPSKVLRDAYDLEGKGCETCCDHLTDEELIQMNNKFSAKEILEDESTKSIRTIDAAEESIEMNNRLCAEEVLQDENVTSTPIRTIPPIIDDTTVVEETENGKRHIPDFIPRQDKRIKHPENISWESLRM